MAKDPAFLFYHHDFLVGTAFMSLADRGAYITILCHMAALQRPMDLKEIQAIAGTTISNELSSKFVKKRGKWLNIRLMREVEKRKAFCLTRSQSRTSNVCSPQQVSLGSHTVNVNENSIIKPKNIKTVYSEEFEKIWGSYPSPLGKKDAYRHYKSSVATDQDKLDIWTALNNYKASTRVSNGYILNGSTWFNQWQDWVVMKLDEGDQWKTKNLIRK